MSTAQTPPPPPMEREDPPPSGCCGWFGGGKKRSSSGSGGGAAKKYALAPHTEIALAEAEAAAGTHTRRNSDAEKPDTKRQTTKQTTAAAAAPNAADEVHAIQAEDGAGSTPTKPKADDADKDRAASSAATQAAVSTPATAAPSELCAEWSATIRALQVDSSSGSKPATDRSPAMDAFIAAQGFSPLLAALIALAQIDTSPAALTNKPSLSLTPSGSFARQSSVEQLHNAVDLPTVHVTSAAVGGSPPATSRWTRRQELRAQREQELVLAQLQQQQLLAANGTRTTPTTLRHMDSLHTIGQSHASGNRVPLFEKHSSVEHTRHGSMSRMSAAGAAADGANDEDVTNRRFSGKSPLGVQVTEDGTSVVASSQFRLPLDLRSAQELNQRQQAHQQSAQPETAHTATAGAAHMDAMVDPEVFRGLEALASSMGQQLVLANMAEMGAQMRAASTTSAAAASDASSSALTSPASVFSEDDADEESAERASVGLIHPLDVFAWVGALAFTLNQLALADRAAALLKMLGVAPDPQAQLLAVNASESAALREHVRYLMELTSPLLALYALGSEPPSSLASPADPTTLFLLPPRAWIIAQASDTCVRALMPSRLPSTNALVPQQQQQQQEPTWFGALELLETELRHTAQQLCYPTATAHAQSILSLRSAALALRKLGVGLRWLQQGLSVAAADGSPPPAFAIVLRLHPFLLHALMELFWSRLAGAASLVRDDEESALRSAWQGWHACVSCIADTVSSVCCADSAWISDAPVLRAVHATLSGESTTTLMGAVGPGVIVAVPPLVELLTALTSLACDPVSQPLESEPAAAASTQLATVRAIDATARLVSSRPFLLMQAALPPSDGAVQHPDPSLSSSPLLQLTWFWDLIAALFTPVTGCLFSAASPSSSSDDLYASSLTVQQLVVAFVADLIFSPGSNTAPYPCPWILDGTFVAAYLQMHYAALIASFHAPSSSSATSSSAQESLALSHAKVLRCAAAIPSALAVESVVAGSSVKHVVRLSHVHLQLYHLGIVSWISAQISLEMECGAHSKHAAAEAGFGSEMEALGNGGGGGGGSGDDVQQLDPAIVSKSGSEDESKSDRKSGSKNEDEEDEDEDGSEFSDISFSDSDAGFDDEHVPAPMLVAPKLAIVQGERHINEQFALGWDGQPLHPEPPPVAPIVLADNAVPSLADDQAASAAAAAAAAELLHEGSRSSGSSDDDLGESGWGESMDSVANSPRAAAAVTKLVIPPKVTVAENDSASAVVPGPELVALAPEDDDGLAGLAPSPSPSPSAPPVFMPAMSSPFADEPVSSESYDTLRARHLLYRSPALHAAMIDLLLQLLLDPSNPAHALNALYVGRFPLQASAEQQRLADAFHVQQAALESTQQRDASESFAAYSASMDDLVAPSDALPPLATNVLFALDKHVNHSANDYLCARVVHLAAMDASARRVDVSRARSLRRLTKLLFEQLFSTRVYANRTQIGRGRFAAVYSASYGAQPVALKQVEQPATLHDQMTIVDLFTEIAILEVLGESDRSSSSDESSAPAATPSPACVPLLDFGVGEGCIWIVMPLAECSAKSYKLAEAQRMAEEDEEEQMARDKKKRKRPSPAVVQEREKARLRSQTLIRSLLSSTLDADSVCSVLEGSSLLSVICDLHRKVLSSLALYAQVLQCAQALQRHSVVHFDIKADNLLILAEEPIDTGVVGAALAPPLPIRVTLADFGEAMFIPQSGSLAAMALSAENGIALGSRISRGTENIQSPEMLTLIRSLDVTDSSHDRRKANGVDGSSDLWSLGALFYELVMHHYGHRDVGGMGGQGMLFEEAGGLPIFLQVTNASLPLIADDKREMLKQPEHLGAALLAILESFLAFVLAKEKTRRPSLDQIRAKFNAVVAEVVSEITRSSSSAGSQKQLRVKDVERHREAADSIDRRASLAAAASSHGHLASAQLPDLSSCVCSPPPSCWSGDVPAFRCCVCTRRTLDASAAHASLRHMCARDGVSPCSSSPSSALPHALGRNHFVAASWDSSSMTLMQLQLGAVESSSQPLLLIVDHAVPLPSAVLTSLSSRRVHFLAVRAVPADCPSCVDGDVSVQLPAQLYLRTAADESYAVHGESLEAASCLLRDHSVVQLLVKKPRATALIAVLAESAGVSHCHYSPSSFLVTPLALHAGLRIGWTAMQS